VKKVLLFSSLWYKLGGVEEDDCLLKKGNLPACSLTVFQAENALTRMYLFSTWRALVLENQL